MRIQIRMNGFSRHDERVGEKEKNVTAMKRIRVKQRQTG